LNSKVMANILSGKSKIV